MAGYGYSYRGYTTYNTPSSDDAWRKTSHGSDHVRREVIYDADGGQRTTFSGGADQNPGHYVEKTIIQQRIVSPVDSEYKHGRQWTEDPCGAENKFRKPLTSTHGHPQNVEEFITKVPTEASQPKVFWNQNHGYTDDYGKQNEFHNKDLLKPGGYAHRKDNRDDYYHNQGNNHSGNYFESKDLLKPGGNAQRNGDYEDYYRKQGTTIEPSMITSGGWAKPSHSTWAATPNGSLCGATNDIDAAVGLLKEIAKPSVITSPQSMYREPAYTETINGKEAARRNGNFNSSSRPYKREDSYNN